MLVLAKALNQKFAHQAGYALIDGRWKKTTADMKGVKNAPKAAHPKAGGKGHKPFAMPEADTGKLLYPADKEATNKDIKNFNQKHVPNLLAHAAKGDIAAILGSSYGVNTHGKKLALIANFLLDQMGSKEQVVAGQKAGEHPAISSYEREPETVEQMTEQAVEAVAQEAKAEATEQTAEGRDAAPADAPKPGELVMPQFASGKNSQGVRTGYEMQAQKIIDAPDLAALQALPTKAGSWKGITPNSKKLLNLYAQAIAKAKGENPNAPLVQPEEATPLTAVETIATSLAQPDTSDGKEAPKAAAAKKSMDGIDWSKYAVAENIKNAKSYNAQIDAIKAAGEVGNINAILAMTYGKNTYGLKVAKAANHVLSELGYPDIKVVIGKDAVHPMLGQFTQAEMEQKASAAIEQQKAAVVEEGPKEGQTRQGKSGMLVFKDGHWVKQGTDEPAKEQPVPGEFKKGQKLSPLEVMSLPAGSIIQTYDKNGKPYLTVMMGHATAWPLSKKGAPLSKPFQAGQYMELINFTGKTNADDNGYISGYHHSKHPTELVELGKPDHLSDKQKNVIKNMWNGVLSVTPDAGVYPTNSSAVIVGNPANPGSGMWVNEKGDWGHIAGFSNLLNPVYQDFMMGKEPATNLADALGLAAAPKADGKTFANPPQTGNEFIDSTCESIQDNLNQGNWALAVDDINDMVTVVRDDQAMTNDFHKVELAAWLIEAVSAAKKELGDISVKSLPTPPAYKAERVTSTAEPQLPEFADVGEYNAWAEKNLQTFMDSAEAHYGSDIAFAVSSVGQELDKWIDISNAEKSSAEKAIKHDRKKEKAQELNTYDYWESIFDVLSDAGSVSQATQITNDWIAANGSDAPQLNAIAEALSDHGFKEMASDYHSEAMKVYPVWWSEKYPGEPMKPNLDPTENDVKGNPNLQGYLNNIAGEVHAGKLGDPAIIDLMQEKIMKSSTLSDFGKMGAENYITKAKAYLVKNGPQEGDTKQGVGGMLVFHNGHWILQSEMPEVSANGSAGSEIMAFKQAIADQNGDDVVEIGLEFLKDNHHDKGAYTTVVDNIIAMNPAQVFAAAQIGAQYFKKHGKPLNLPIKPAVDGLYSGEATTAQGYAIAATIATKQSTKDALVAALQDEYDATPNKTADSQQMKAYLGSLVDALKAPVGKPKTVAQLTTALKDTSNAAEVHDLFNEYVANKGFSHEGYKDLVLAAGDETQLLSDLKVALKSEIDMAGLPEGIPKAKYTGSSMADADVLDGLSAMAAIAKYSDSPEMKEAVLNSVKESAYALTAAVGTDLNKMQLSQHAIDTMIYVQDQIQGGEPIEPIKTEPEVPELGNIDVDYLDKMKVISDTSTGAKKTIKAAVASLNYYNLNPDKADAISTIKSVLIINDFTPIAIDGIVKSITNNVAVAELSAMDKANKSDDGPKEGDMKPGANGMLVLKNGHWVKASPDEIPMPDFTALGLSSWQHEHYSKYAENIKNKLKAGEGTKGVVMQKADGSMLVYGELKQKVKVNVEGSAPGKMALAQYASMVMLATGHKLKSGWTPEKGTYAMAGVAQVMKATAASSNPAENNLTPEAPLEVKKYEWKKKGPISVDEWEVTGGNQGGSNDGMKMKDADGQEWYVKFPDNEDHAKAEVLTAKLYGAAGFSAQDAMIVTKDGKMAIASKWENLKKAKTHAALAKAKGMLEGFAVDAWLGNWDVVGLAKDNVQLKEDGTIHRVDAGGSLMFRAQGKKKDFGPEVTELETFMDPSVNPNSAAVFGGMAEADITASVAKVLAISDAKIAHMVNQYGPGDDKAKSELVQTLIKRKEFLAEKYPEAATVLKKQNFKPEKISTPPDFLNWSGVGKSGPSSKQILNQANHDAAQAIYAAALTGDTDAIRSLTAPIFDKDTEKETGQVPVLDHPSQHIKGYAMQALNEINSQMKGHSQEQFRIGGDHPLYSMHEEYKPDSWSGNSADKIGQLLVLGYPGIVDEQDLGLKKVTYKAGQLTTNTYAKAAQEVWEKLPMTQKQAVQAYTGSSYTTMNSGLWKGNPNAQALAAAQALSTMGHEIAPGTTFGRKFSLNSSELAKLTASVGKVIMEPAIMSTSISPDVWSGNIHLKMTAGPGVKGIYAGAGSLPGGGSISHHTGEKEIILPPNTRLLITKVTTGKGTDSDGFGNGSNTIVECIILPSL